MKSFHPAGFSIATAVMLLIAASGRMTAQPKYHHFLIGITTHDGNATLVAKKGCSWKTLEFPLAPNTEQAVNDLGLTTVETSEQERADKPEKMLFTIERTVDGLRLRGIKGIAWPDLSFSCSGGGCNQWINEYGMAKAPGSIPEPPRHQRFLIRIKTRGNEGTLIAGKGCSWKELQFKLAENKSIGVDEHGLVTNNLSPQPHDRKTVHFLLAIERTKDGLTVRGMQGAYFKDVSFSCANGRCDQWIDERGMTDNP